MRIELKDGFYLSPVQEGDQPAYVQHLADKDTSDRLLKVPFPYTAEDANFWVNLRLNAAKTESRPSHFAIRRGDGFLLGGIGLELGGGETQHRAELGYWISKDYRGRGVMTAAVNAVTRYGFRDLGLRRIQATAFTTNTESHRVLEKAGFTREGLLASYYIKAGKLIDVYMYVLLASVQRAQA
jgi:ribosomal-protein-alanine N-acetyltransferase